jgi:transcriptional antiterminator RfaH
MASARRTASFLRNAIDARRWYAAHTLPHREASAEAQLSFQSFETFLPAHMKTVRHARRFTTKRAPFFPRYLFVRLNLARERWRAVNGTAGVASLIMEGDLPKPVPAGVVESLLAIADASGLLSFAPLIRPGQNVRILTGPFAERVGRLIEADDQDRVQVLLDAMGASVVVRATGEALAPVA